MTHSFMGPTNTGYGLLGLREVKARLEVVSSLNPGEQRDTLNFYCAATLLPEGFLQAGQQARRRMLNQSNERSKGD